MLVRWTDNNADTFLGRWCWTTLSALNQVGFLFLTFVDSRLSIYLSLIASFWSRLGEETCELFLTDEFVFAGERIILVDLGHVELVGGQLVVSVHALNLLHLILLLFQTSLQRNLPLLLRFTVLRLHVMIGSIFVLILIKLSCCWLVDCLLLGIAGFLALFMRLS